MDALAPLAAALPDLPRWVLARGLLCAGRAQALGVELGARPAGVVLARAMRLALLVGRPAREHVLAAAGSADEIVATPEDAAWAEEALAGWTSEPAVLHALDHPARLPAPEPGVVRFLRPGELPGVPDLPAELRVELAAASARTRIASAWRDGRALAFCYAVATTEGWWDVSVDTLEPHRRQGHATRCFLFLARHMARAGKRALWGAAASNPASARLAEKLGLAPVDALVVFARAPFG